MKFRIRWFGWIGLLLFAFSVRPSVLMLMESWVMNQASERYAVTDDLMQGLAEHPDGSASVKTLGHEVTFRFGNLSAETVHSAMDGYEKTGDIEILLDGKPLDRLTERILRNHEPRFQAGILSAMREVSVFTLLDKETGKRTLNILANITPRTVRKDPELEKVGLEYGFSGDLKEIQKFRMYSVDASGNIVRSEFGYHGERTPLQTMLAEEVADIPFGYYTDDAYAWPIQYFPYTFPFGTCLVGCLLLIFGVRRVNPWI